MEKLLRRKIDTYLEAWKNNPERKPLIVKGARQIGKTRSIEAFAAQNYKHVIEINFVEQKNIEKFLMIVLRLIPFSKTSLCSILRLNLSLRKPYFSLMSCKHALIAPHR
ncbi:AAA family ATPase [Prevotella disiens]|uniref:AAA family ATPase n=1 Tax=Prevotella disiens TaxID=28130 RepID=UPI000B0F27FF|nr:AAA family ATPase [Prevotella disiens]